MDKITLYVDVEGLVARNRNRSQHIVCKNEEYQIEFTFDSAWDSYSDKTARFIWNGEYHDVPFKGNICPVPEIHGTPYVTVGVYVDDIIRTTTGAEILCNPSILCYDSEPSTGNDERYCNEAKEAAKEAQEARDEISAMFEGITHIAPHIGDNGNWYVEEFDTGVRAAGVDGMDGRDGEDGAAGRDGENGKDGKDGKDGANGITPHIGTNGHWFIGNTDTGVVAQGKDGQNGQNGKDGRDGVNGKDGRDGADGTNGITPRIGANGHWMIGNTDTGVVAEGKNGIDGRDGNAGKDGKDGTNGADGYTPVRGTDYWTPEDIAEIEAYIDEKIANSSGGDDSGGGSGELVWTDYELDTFAGSVTIENASEYFPDGTYMVKADGSIDADSTWTFKSGSGTVDSISFSNGLEWVYVTYTYINDGMDYINRLVFDADLPISSLSFAKID